MKPIDILSAIRQWAKASPDEILDSPAWAVPCRLGEEPCTMRAGELRPAETLDLAIRIGEEDHVLGIVDIPAFAELHAVWPSRADLPEPVLIALVEKDCGAFLQLLENALRGRLRIMSIASGASASADRRMLHACVTGEAGTVAEFTLDITPAVAAELGRLRCLDLSHEVVRGFKVSAETEYAAVLASEGDLAALEPGDTLLLPELGTVSPRIIAAGTFSVSESGVAQWKDDGLLRVCSAESAEIDLGTLFDAAEGSSTAQLALPSENAPLKLVRGGKTVATGRFVTLADRPAFAADDVRRA